jgi:hypothetical protein
MVPLALALLVGGSGHPATAPSSETEMLAYELGSSLGTAIYCREPSAEAFGRRVGARLRARASGAADWSRAVRVLADAASLRAEHGPLTETCTQFRPRYHRALDHLDAHRRGPRSPPPERRRPRTSWQRVRPDPM